MDIRKKISPIIDIGVKTAVGFLPGPLSAAFNAICDNIKDGVLAKRAEKWQEEVMTRLLKLELDYESLINSEVFATALIKTSELAVKTESDEKRKILADSLINAYVLNIDEDKSIFYLSLVERYTVLHVQIIRYLHDEYINDSYPLNIKPTFMALFRYKFSGIDQLYLEKVISDLQNDYMVISYKKDASILFLNKKMELLTNLGKEFYQFIISYEE